jgi:hypothetical protein
VRAIPPPAILPLVLTGAALVAACGAERAIRVGLDVDAADGDSLCVLAHGANELVFAAPYAVAALPAGERSLTFVAGDEVRQSVRLSARVSREGRTISRASTEARFAEGVVDRRLAPRRCVEGGPVGLGARPGGTFATLGASPRMLAADFDGDGRDELLALGADGSLLVLDAHERDAGSRRATELRAPEGELVASGDLDGDCLLEIVAAAPLGALVVVGESGASPRPVGGTRARDVAIGVRGGSGTRAIAIAGDAGLLVTPWDEDAPRTIASGAFTQVRAGDLTGDGRDDLVAVGAAGTRVLVAVEDGFQDEPGALPAAIASATGPIALGDLDGDGSLDLVSASGATLRIALNRGDGLLEDRSGAIPPGLGAEARRVTAADLDGDCAEEIVALDAGGQASVWARDARGAFVALAGVPGASVRDVTVLDADGDGASEVALLDAAGAVTLWRP